MGISNWNLFQNSNLISLEIPIDFKIRLSVLVFFVLVWLSFIKSYENLTQKTSN